MKPVSVGPFFKEDDDGVGSIDADIGFEAPADNAPVLEWDNGGTWTPISDGGTVDAPGGSVTIRVTNAADYDTIEWYCNGFPGRVDRDTFIVNTASFPFGAVGIYPVSVVGKKDGEGYSTFLYINVGS